MGGEFRFAVVGDAFLQLDDGMGVIRCLTVDRHVRRFADGGDDGGDDQPFLPLASHPRDGRVDRLGGGGVHAESREYAGDGFVAVFDVGAQLIDE